MVTPKTLDSENAHMVAALAAAKEATGMTFDQISAQTGMNVRSVKRYLADERVMQVKQIRALTKALGLNYLAVIEEAVNATE